MRKIEWDVETAYEAGLGGKVNDVVWVIYARENNRICLTFDELRAEQGEQVARELRQNGGHIIKLPGGPDQSYYRSIGKLWFHYPEWLEFLSENNGISILSDIRIQSCRNYTPEEYHQKYHKIDAEQFEKYLEKRKKKPYRPRGIRRKSQPDQSSLI